MEEQTAILFAAVNGYLLDVPVEKIGPFIRSFLEYLKSHNTAMMESIARTGATTAETESELRKAVESYKQLKQ
jgi:F-type H+-transporting ATPase subunit alpha